MMDEVDLLPARPLVNGRAIGEPAPWLAGGKGGSAVAISSGLISLLGFFVNIEAYLLLKNLMGAALLTRCL